jgi:3-deoxy-D-manno-oct-2-ulosonic acid (Kdo) hydroxylase
MPLLSISLEELDRAMYGSNGRRATEGVDCPELRDWCAKLETGSILYFPQTPLPIPPQDLQFLLKSEQSSSAIHKNIAYKPTLDKLSGIETKSLSSPEAQELRAIMRRYSESVSEFIGRFFVSYGNRWDLDYASYRPIEEQGRDLPTRRRNDLIHTDAFPTRPTRGRRILRFFHNIHPGRTRDWVVGEPFARVVGAFTPGKLELPRAEGPVARAGKRLAVAAGLGSLVPGWKRTPYDTFMMRLHNTMKEDAGFQKNCVKEEVQFAPGSSWMVYTETVPHSVIAGQYALEQTVLVEPEAMVVPGSAPIAVLESMAGQRLV